VKAPALALCGFCILKQVSNECHSIHFVVKGCLPFTNFHDVFLGMNVCARQILGRVVHQLGFLG
jgi:hypothetical protein